jgi:glycerophosphoryl diester phosphodiesterase
MIIYSHRGIDFERTEQLPENSLEAFKWAGAHGFGVELDMQLNSQGEIIVAHDSTATRWSQGRCNQKWSEISIPQLRVLEQDCGKIPLLKDVLQLAKEQSMHLAIHLKGANQSSQVLNSFINLMSSWKNSFEQFLVFDCKLTTAKILREKLPTLNLAPSIATSSDIARYNTSTDSTLYSLDNILNERTFAWAWLDEWQPTLYEKQTFERLRDANINSVVISPELHKTEKHPDAQDLKTLESRWKQILSFKPDAICTDYPTRVANLLETVAR